MNEATKSMCLPDFALTFVFLHEWKRWNTKSLCSTPQHLGNQDASNDIGILKWEVYQGTGGKKKGQAGQGETESWR